MWLAGVSISPNEASESVKGLWPEFLPLGGETLSGNPSEHTTLTRAKKQPNFLQIVSTAKMFLKPPDDCKEKVIAHIREAVKNYLADFFR